MAYLRFPRGALPEVLTRDDVKELVENARKLAPAVVEELIPDKMGYGEVQAVLRNLLAGYKLLLGQ